MKEFLKYVSATIVATLIMLVVVVGLAVACIASIISSSDAPSVKSKSVLVINLSGTITEQAQDNTLSSFFGRETNQTGLNDILSAIKKAALNDKIEGIYIEIGALSAGYTTLTELRNALLEFKTSGKWICSYGDNYTQGAYYVASVADKVCLNPQGSIDIHGVSSQVMYIKDMAEKFGVRFQIAKVGNYKSATERYSEDHMSEANREQLTAYITGVWSNFRSAVAQSRGLSEAMIDSLANELTLFIPNEKLVEYGLVDELLYSDEMKAMVKDTLYISQKDVINQLSVADMKSLPKPKESGSKIAVYYAEGDIVDVPIDYISQDGVQIVGDKMCADLEALAKDDEVKAVVLRVNSPGGSAYASEKIWHAVTMLKEKKPVVVSMGDYAASGGYYISCGASWLFAQPTTLTGSIGIYGIIPEASELLTKKLALHFDGVKTHEHSDMMSSVLTRPFSSDEMELMQTYIERGYKLFLTRVAEGRNRTIEEVDAIAQGHVWLGQDANHIGLVDSLGGLDEAVAKAAELADATYYYTEEYPEVESWLDALFSDNARKSFLDDQMRLLLGDLYLPFVYMKSLSQQSPIQAALPYYISIN